MDDYTACMAPTGYRRGPCGYCHSPGYTSANYYASAAENFSPVLYQELADRGWRRSGTTYYKPDSIHQCCPHHTIRLNAHAYRPKRGQRRASNRFRNYILGHEYQSKVAILCPRDREEKKRSRDKFDLIEAVREPEYRYLKHPTDPKTKKLLQPAHKLEVTLEPDKATVEKFNLYLQYQTKVHGDRPQDVKQRSFANFLCSGFPRTTIDEDGRRKKIGSYHQCYRVDGKLIALGVIDLLPHAVSSVYFIYDPAFGDFDLGKISAMREICLAAEEGYEWYYMGYYVHSCPKMRYKADYAPTYLLNTTDYSWDLLDKHNADHLNETRPHPRFRSPWQVWDAEMTGVMTVVDVMREVSTRDIVVKYQGHFHSLYQLVGEWELLEMREYNTITAAAAEFVACVGPDLASKIILDPNWG